jgi:glycosyltransferase involved in cell wall biosynthesis
VRALRVAITTGNLVNVVDGVSLTLRRVVAHLQHHGHVVRVLGPACTDPVAPSPAGYWAVRSVPVPVAPGYRLAVATPAQIADRLDRFRPDLVHVATPDLLGTWARGWALARGVPLVASYHTNFPSYLRHLGPAAPLEPAAWWLARRFYRGFRHVYVPSGSIADELRARGVGAPLRPWTRGVDRELFDPARRSEAFRRRLGADPAVPVVLFVGRLRREKGVRRLAQVLGELSRSHRPPCAVVVGDGPSSASLRRALPSTAFLGHLEGVELATAYASADVFVQPSDTETFGNVTLEAMASGLPVVALDAPGSRSLVRPSETGLLVEERALAPAVATLCGDETRRQWLGARARQRSGEFSWARALDQLLRHYEEAAELGAALPAPAAAW